MTTLITLEYYIILKILKSNIKIYLKKQYNSSTLPVLITLSLMGDDWEMFGFDSEPYLTVQVHSPCCSFPTFSKSMLQLRWEFCGGSKLNISFFEFCCVTDQMQLLTADVVMHGKTAGCDSATMTSSGIPINFIFAVTNYNNNYYYNYNFLFS